MSLKFSGFVFTYNEEKWLRECLQALSFCEEILVVDLGSTDASKEIAKEFPSVRLIEHELVPIPEIVYPKIIPSLANDWIFKIDPDMIFEPQLLPEMIATIENSPDDLAILNLPTRHHFRNKPLNYTKWGGIQYWQAVFNRQRVNLTKRVHIGIRPKPGYSKMDMHSPSGATITHYWMESWKNLFENHIRYIKLEGNSRYYLGKRFGIIKTILRTASAFMYSYFLTQGFREGVVGLLLSIFYTGYEFFSNFSLLAYQVTRRNQ